MEFRFEVAGSHAAAGNQVGVLRLQEAGGSKPRRLAGVGRPALWVEVRRTGSAPRRHGS
jgi:hypothetical protein